MRELTINKSHDTSPAPDQIQCQLLKHLPLLSLIFWWHLEICNVLYNMARSNCYSNFKPDKNHSNPSNYRPIALSSFICKTMESIVNDRLVWRLETNHLITKFQSGFRQKWSMIDPIICLETFCKEASVNKNMWLQSFLIWRNQTIQHGITEFYHT